MINAWNSLSQDNKVKLVIVILVAVFSVIAYLWQSEVKPTKPISNNTPVTIEQTTSGNNSPVISNTKGNVIFNSNSPDSGKP